MAISRQSFYKAAIILVDFIILNVLLWFTELVFGRRLGIVETHEQMIFFMAGNLSLAISQLFFYPIVQERKAGAGMILRRVAQLSSFQALLFYATLLTFSFKSSIILCLFLFGTFFFVSIVFARLVERIWMKKHRRPGKHARKVLLVGSDPEILNVFDRISGNLGWGYNVLGYYGDPLPESRKDLLRLGGLDDFMNGLSNSGQLVLGEEMYVCLSRLEKKSIKRISQFCDQHVISFYYVPVSVETLGLNLKRELLEDMEVFTTYENPLQNPFNRIVKRTFDIVVSLIALIFTGLLFPFIALIIKLQSPGPIIFRQERTGLDGKTFVCYKFRSMHVNADADKVQATEHDPRKFKFGDIMRKTNIDELPQFWNVLKGDMSIVGPRPHMLAHTEMYRELIDKYMVRHFVRPGVTGWAQVTGFRGETKELWQMEGRVKRDIWYIENWSFWLDLRIIWLTFKSIFVHDEHAY